MYIYIFNYVRDISPEDVTMGMTRHSFRTLGAVSPPRPLLAVPRAVAEKAAAEAAAVAGAAEAAVLRKDGRGKGFVALRNAW